MDDFNPRLFSLKDENHLLSKSAVFIQDISIFNPFSHRYTIFPFSMYFQSKQRSNALERWHKPTFTGGVTNKIIDMSQYLSQLLLSESHRKELICIWNLIRRFFFLIKVDNILVIYHLSAFHAHALFIWT